MEPLQHDMGGRDGRMCLFCQDDAIWRHISLLKGPSLVIVTLEKRPKKQTGRSQVKAESGKQTNVA